MRQLVRAAMTFDNILGAVAISVVMIYLVVALIRPERF
jgi:K+-transporting ATPase KdpF subunit